LLILVVACASKTKPTPTRPVEQTPTIACDGGPAPKHLAAYPLFPSGADVQPVDYAQALQVIAALRGYSAAQSRAYQSALSGTVVPALERNRFTQRCLDDYRHRGVIN
jgi:hypothetical protein